MDGQGIENKRIKVMYVANDRLSGLGDKSLFSFLFFSSLLRSLR